MSGLTYNDIQESYKHKNDAPVCYDLTGDGSVGSRELYHSTNNNVPEDKNDPNFAARFNAAKLDMIKERQQCVMDEHDTQNHITNSKATSFDVSEYVENASANPSLLSLVRKNDGVDSSIEKKFSANATETTSQNITPAPVNKVEFATDMYFDKATIGKSKEKCEHINEVANETSKAYQTNTDRTMLTLLAQDMATEELCARGLSLNAFPRKSIRQKLLIRDLLLADNATFNNTNDDSGNYSDRFVMPAPNEITEEIENTLRKKRLIRSRAKGDASVGVSIDEKVKPYLAMYDVLPERKKNKEVLVEDSSTENLSDAQKNLLSLRKKIATTKSRKELIDLRRNEFVAEADDVVERTKGSYIPPNERMTIAHETFLKNFNLANPKNEARKISNIQFISIDGNCATGNKSTNEDFERTGGVTHGYYSSDDYQYNPRTQRGLVNLRKMELKNIAKAAFDEAQRVKDARFAKYTRSTKPVTDQASKDDENNDQSTFMIGADLTVAKPGYQLDPVGEKKSFKRRNIVGEEEEINAIPFWEIENDGNNEKYKTPDECAYFRLPRTVDQKSEILENYRTIVSNNYGVDMGFDQASDSSRNTQNDHHMTYGPSVFSKSGNFEKTIRTGEKQQLVREMIEIYKTRKGLNPFSKNGTVEAFGTAARPSFCIADALANEKTEFAKVMNIANEVDVLNKIPLANCSMVIKKNYEKQKEKRTGEFVDKLILNMSREQPVWNPTAKECLEARNADNWRGVSRKFTDMIAEEKDQKGFLEVVKLPTQTDRELDAPLYSSFTPDNIFREPVLPNVSKFNGQSKLRAGGAYNYNMYLPAITPQNSTIGFAQRKTSVGEMGRKKNNVKFTRTVHLDPMQTW